MRCRRRGRRAEVEGLRGERSTSPFFIFIYDFIMDHGKKKEGVGSRSGTHIGSRSVTFGWLSVDGVNNGGGPDQWY